MIDKPREEKVFTIENPPGNQWVLMRSGNAKWEIYNGSSVPKRWLIEETGHIFVKKSETDEWLRYDRKREVFCRVSADWQGWANDEWNRQTGHSLAKKSRESIRQIDLFDNKDRVEWDKFFKKSNPHSKTRAEIFPNGTANMSEAEIIDFIQKNNSFLLAGGVDPLEFPEIIDEALRPLCNTINQTSWARSADGCAGHPMGEKGHTFNGYNKPYIRVFLDLNDPLASKFIKDTEKMADDWIEKYKNLKISLKQETIISSNDEPRIVRCMIGFEIEPPSGIEKDDYIGSEECRQISSSFFDELEKRISAIGNQNT